MTVTATFSVFCDQDACLVWIGEEDSRGKARRTARAFGWECKKNVDLCGRHRSGPQPACERDGALLDHYGDCSYCGKPTLAEHADRGQK